MRRWIATPPFLEGEGTYQSTKPINQGFLSVKQRRPEGIEEMQRLTPQWPINKYAQQKK